MFTLSLINPTTEIPFFTRSTRNAVWSTTRGGEERLRAIIDDVSLSDAVRLFDKTTLAFVRVSKNAEIAWQGVVTDVQLTYNNNRYAIIVNAVGYSFLLKNTHVTGMFSTTDQSQLLILNNSLFPNSVDDQRVQKKRSQPLSFTVPAGSTFQGGERICIGYRCPDKSSFTIYHVLFLWLVSNPAYFILRLYGITNAPSDNIWAFNYISPSLQTNQTVSFSLGSLYQAIVFEFLVPTDTTIPYDVTFTLAGFRLSRVPPPVTAETIINLTAVFTINNVSSQSDLFNVVVEDKTYAELFDMVCKQDNIEYTTRAPNVVELRQRDSLEHREKYRIVADTLNIARDATTIANNVYARYRDSINRTLRTQRVDDVVARDVFANGIFRDAYIDVDTYNESVATAKRDEALAAMRSGSMRLRATTRNVATASQSPVPIWKVRAGAIAGIVNLGRIGYGQVSEVIIDRTDYDAATDTLTIESQIDAL